MQINPKSIEVLNRECAPGKEFQLTKDFDVKIIGRDYRGIKHRPKDLLEFAPSVFCLDILGNVFEKDGLVVEGKFADMLFGLYTGAQETFGTMTKEALQRMIMVGINGLHGLGYIQYKDNTKVVIPTTELAISTNPWICYTHKLLDLFDYRPVIIV